MAGALWYWHRFRAMGLSELWHRIFEKVGKITEPFALSGIKNVRITEVEDYPPLPTHDSAPLLLKQTLANDAEKLRDGKWSLFGWKEVQVSSPPDWHLDYMRNVSVPTNGRLNHRSLPGGADVRTIWEINRWAEMVRLAMHGWLNGDIAAIQGAQEWLGDWVEKNPAGQGINWTSALEGGLRLINFCWFDALVSKMADGRLDMGREQAELRDAIVPPHVWWVHRHLSFGSSANNHRLGELTGLLLAVKRWPEMERIAGTAESVWMEISDCIMTQFAEDGGNREQALHYHLFAYEMALHACNAMKVTDGPVIDRLQRAAEFFVRMSHPQEPWDYGDSDDAQIVPLTMQRGKAVAEWCAWMRQGSSGSMPETSPSGILPDQPHGDAAMALSYWVGCAPGHGKNAHATGWWIAKESGMAVIERDGWRVRVDASPLGLGKMAAHGHCDALHVSIWDGEHALVIDPGTGGYFGAKEMRAELASWDAHNGPQPVEGFKTPRRMGTFLWAGEHLCPLYCHGEDDIAIRFTHEQFAVSRDIRFLENQTLGIRDYEASKRSLRTRWCLAPGCSASISESDQNTVHISCGIKSWKFSIVSEKSQLMLKNIEASPSYGNIKTCIMIELTGPENLCVEWQRNY